MAELTQGRVDIISRENGTLLSQTAGGSSQSINLTEPSVVRISGTRDMVTQFERQGNDLVLKMRDGSTVRYQKFFLDDADGQHSELVFDDGVNPPEHALFPQTAEGAELASSSVTPTYESLDSVEPLLLADNTNTSMGVITAGGLGVLGLAGLAVGIGGGGGGGNGGGNDGGTDPGTPVTPGTPAITLNTFAGDDVLDNAEKATDQVLSGTTSNVEAGQIVTVTLGGQTYNATVGADGSWSVTIPAAALAGLAAGTTTIDVSVTNTAGTAATGSLPITVTAADPGTPATPAISLNPFAGDNLLDNSEKTTPQTVSGSTSNVEAGQIVTVTLGGQTYNGTVGADGSWSVAIPAAALAGLAAGSTTIGVSVTNAAGTAATGSLPITVAAADPGTPATPVISLNPFAGDNLLDNSEKATPQTLSGSTGNVEAGQIVTVTLGGQSYSGSVAGDGSWSITVPAEALSALASGTTTVTATVTNQAGTAASGSLTLTVEAPLTQPGTPVITIDQFAGDDILSNAEKSGEQLLSGSTTNVETGQIVTITLGDQTYSALVDAQGNWSITLLPAQLNALAAGTVAISAVVTNQAGTEASENRAISVDTPVVTGPPAVTVDDFTGDNQLSNAEKAADQTVTGSTSNIEPGQLVTVTLGGQTYSGSVDAQGNWSVTLPSAALSALAAGETTLSVSVSNAAGNTVTGSLPISVEAPVTQPGEPTVTIGQFAGDDILSNDEKGTAQTLSGTTTNIEAGQTVTVTLGGQTYLGTVDGSGNWSVIIPAAALGNLPAGSNAIGVTVSNAAGVTTSETRDISVDAPTTEPGVPALTLNDFAVDNALSNDEKAVDQLVSGTTSNVEAGQLVTVTLGGQTYSASVQGDGSWSVTVPSAALNALAAGTTTLTVSVSNAAGDTATAAQPITVEAPATQPGQATVTIDAFAGDDILSNSEKASDQLLSGTTTNIAEGQQVTVTLNGETFTATVGADGSWSVTIPASSLAALTAGSATLNVTVNDQIGTPVSETRDFLVEASGTAPGTPTLTINAFADDNVLSNDEKLDAQAVSGSTINVEAGQIVTVTLGGQNYSGTVGADGSWNIAIPADALGALAAGAASLVVTVSNAAGTTVSDTLGIIVEPPVTEPGQPVITIDQFAGDDVLSNDEKTSDQLLSGTTTNVEAGQTVTVTLGDQTYSATVGADGSWSLSVPASALAALATGSATIAATVTSQAGVTVSEDRVIAVEAPAEPGTPTVTIALFAGDDLVDNSEKAVDQTLSGSTSNVEAGQTVTITLGGQNYSALVNPDGSWSAQIPSAALSALAAGTTAITVSVTSVAGALATDSRDINVAPAAGEPGVISISEPVSVDGFLNLQELSSDLIIGGSAVGVNPGQAVQLNFNGNNYSAVVGSNGFWSVTVPTGDLNGITDGVKLISVTATDASGALLTDSAQLNVVTTTLPQITLNESALTDGILNQTEADSDLLIGGSTGKAVAGQLVEVQLNGKTYSTTVNDDGSWNLTLPAADLALLPQGANGLTITAIDEAGNRVDETLNFSVDTLPPNLIVAEVAGGDGILNSTEVAAGVPVSGSGALPGEQVTVSLNNVIYSATVDEQGNWTVDLPPAALQALSDGSSYTLVVTLTDASGNIATQAQTLAVSTQPPVATVTAPGGDGVLTNNELTEPLLISGTGTAGDSVAVGLNGKTYAAIVDENGNWRASVPVADLATLSNQTYPVTVTVTDPAGNSSTQDTDLRVATEAPALTLNPLDADGVINISDAQQPLIVSGTGDEGDIIRVTLNNLTYSAVVAQGGNWSVTVPAADLAGVPNGTQVVSVVATDADGNTTPASSSLIFATTPPLLEVSTPGSDGYINIAEHTQDLTIDGRGGTQGDTVAVTFNGETYTATVDTNGAWSVTVPAAIISQLGDALYPVDVVISDAYGNSSTVASSVTVLAATSPALTIDPVTGDNLVDSAEQLTDILVTGSVTGVPAGQPVLLTINGQSYDGVVQANGSWSVTLPAGSLGAAGDKTFTVAITDVAGNPALPAEGQFTVIATNVPSLSIAPISDDNALNVLDAQSDLILSGGSANLPVNSPISVTLVPGGTLYTTTTDETGSWTLTVPAADLANLAQGNTTVTVSSGDVLTSQTLLVATTPLAEPQINTPFTDGILNTEEASTAQTLTGSVQPGQAVSVTLGGISYPATVAGNGDWSVTLPPDALQALAQGSNPVTVTVSDVAGNSTSISEPLTVDTGVPVLTVNPIATDGIINAAETATDLIVSGTVAPGNSVSLVLNGETYSATVAADGSWTATVPAADLQQLTDGRYDLNVTVTSISGNVATTPLPVTVDTTAPDFSINAPAGDGVLNIAEQAAGFSFSGAGSEGDRVSVTLNGVTYTGTVDADGNWALAVPPAALAGLTNGSSYPVVVTVTDAAGNSSSQNSALTVATTSPPLVVAPVSGDNALSTAELAEPLVVSGSGQNGDIVTVQLNDQLYSTTVGVNGQWTLQIDANDLAALPPGTNPLTVTEINANGNQSSQVVDLNVATSPDVQPVLTVDSSTFAGDGIVTAAEQLQPITVRGSSSNVEAGQQVIISLNGTDYSGVVGASGNWSITLPAGALAELGEGSQTLNVSVINAVGNSASSPLNFSVDNTLPSIALAPISDDNYLNAQELGGTVVVSGSTNGLPDGSIITVLANGTTASTSVAADGSWSLTLPAGTFNGASDGAQTITATASDGSGQQLATSDATLTVVASTLPVATPGVAFNDGILNGEEAVSGGVITGNTGVPGDGQTVIVTLGGTNYSGTVDAAGNWQVAVPPAALSALPQGTTPYTVVVSDVAGNSSQADGSLVVDTLPPVLNFITPSDGIINAAESQQPLTLTGSSEANALIVASFNGTSLSTTADVNGNWSLDLPATVYTGLGNGTYPLTVTASDAAGNATTTSRDLALKVEAGTLPTLTLDAFAGNNVVDGAERLTDQRLTGSTSNVEAGQLVTVTIDGTVYSAAVQASGAWSLIVPAGALAAIADGSASFTVAVSDVAGNTTTSNLTFDINSNASGLAMDAISQDNYLNAQELGQPLIVTGTSANVPEGSLVTLLFNNISYTAQVSASGRWSVIVPAESLTALADGAYTVTVTATDSGGATLSSEAALSVLATLPAPQIVSAFGDGLLNSSDITTSQTLSGTTGVTGDGQTVSVVLNGVTYNGTVDSNGNWQISVPASALVDLPEETLNYTVNVQDAAGNSGSSQGSVTVDLTPPTLSLDPVAGDNSVNIAESTAPIVLSGSSNAEAGQQVTLTLNNQIWTTTVTQDGDWSLTLPAGALAGIPAGAYTLTVTVSDAAGNPVTETREITVATGALSVSINTPFGDGYLNQAETTVSQTLSGSTGVAGAGQTVSVTLGDNDYPAAVDAQGNWTLTLTPAQVQALGEGVTTLVVNASDAAGNSGSLTSAVTVDLTPPPLSINPIGGDNIINSVEVLEAVAISGTASVADAGQTVTVSFQNTDYTTRVLSDGTWQVTLPAGVVQGLADGSYPVDVTIRDAAGNLTTATQTLTRDADSLNLPTLTIGAISDDNFLNQAESLQDLSIGGTSTNLVEGQLVTVTLNAIQYSGTVAADGSWTVIVPAADLGNLPDGDQLLVVVSADTSGNPASASASLVVLASPLVQPTLTMNVVAGDDVINATEATADVAVSGGSTLLAAGTPVTVSFNGTDYSTTIDADGNWTVTVPSAAFINVAPGSTQTFTVTAIDVAGNPAVATQEVSFSTTPPVLADITVSAGDTLNLAESLQDLTINGTTTGGLPVTVTLNNVSYTTTADADGNWTLTIPTADVQQLADGPNAITVSVTDAAGNITTDTTTSLDVAFNTLPALTLNTPFGDSLLNLAETQGAITLSGDSTNLPEGSVVNITVGDLTFTTTTDASGTWTLNLAPLALDALDNGVTQVVVTAADAAGNPAQATADVEILQTPPVSANFAATQFGDNVINISEAGSVQLVTGTSNPVAGQTLSVTVGDDNIPLSVTVDASGNWTASLTPEVIASLGAGEHTLTLTTTDRAGNSITETQTFVSAITPIASPTLDTPFTDGRLNAAEAATDGTLTGTVNSDDPASVAVTINGTVYAATLTDGGTGWSLTLPPAVLQSLPDGTLPVTVTVTDENGNIGSTTGTLLVAVNTLPDVTLNLPFGDGALNAAEAGSEQILSGTTGITGAGQTVSVLIAGFNGDQPLAATVLNDGSWSLALSPAQLATFTSGTHTITVTATDIAGNSDVTALSVVTEVAVPVPTFNTGAFGGDNVLNISEAAAGVTLTGSTGSVGDNQAVSITVDLNGSLYSGSVDGNGNWTVDLPGNALSSLGNGTQILTVNVVDAAGNSASAQLPFTTDLSAPLPAVNPEFLGGYVNSDDVATGITLGGTTGEAGANQTVQLTLGGTTYPATVDANGNWTVPLTQAQLSALPDATYPVTVTATDAAGNSTTINSSLVLDKTPPVLSFTAFTGDNALNYAESIQPQILSGTATGAETGAVVTVSLNTTTLGTAIVDGNGNWSVTLTPEQMATFTPSTTLALAVTDLAGNTATSSVPLTVDLTPPPGPLVTLGTVSGDNIISTQDVAGGVVLSGTSANLGAGGVVTVVVNGQTYATTLDAAGNWSTAALPVTAFGNADGSVAITVNATDGTTPVTVSGNVLVDLTPPALTINAFAGDNQVNGNESATSQAISGTADVGEAGRTVVVTFNNQTYSAVVQSDGTWSTTVPASAMQALTDGSTPVITAQLADVAGNVTTVTQQVTVDTAAPLVQVDALAGDNVLNAADLAVSQVLTGSAQGAEGQTIGLYLGDAAPIATATVGADGRWSINLEPNVLSGLTDGALVFGVRVNDLAGNQTDATLTVNKVVNSALTLVVDSVFGDGTLSALDTTVAQTISGTATSAGVGATVSVVLGGTTLSASVGQDGKWAIVVPPAVLDLVTDGNLAVDVTLTDAAGNTRTVGETVTAIVDAVPVVGALTGLFGGDNLLNIAEAAAGQLVGGVIQNAAAGSQVTVTFGSKSYSTTVQAGGAWSVSLPGSDLTSLLDGNLTLGVSVRDAAGNVASNSATIGIFTQTPSISLTSLFGDGVLNLADIATGQVISGVVNNVAQGSVVTLSVGNSQLTATVGAGGAFSATVTPDILGTLAQGNLTVGASVTDAAGNTASTSAGIRVDTLLPTITVNPLFGDGLLNVADALVTQVIGGVVGGAEAGSRVVVSVGSQQFVTATDASGNFNVSLTPALLQGIADGNLTVGVSVTDSAGNTSSTTAGALVGIHNLPKVTLNPLFGDGVLNLAESLVTQTISGTVSGVAAGSSVRLAIGNTTATALVNADGTFSTTVSPAVLSTLLNGNFTVSAAVTDPVGNVSSTSAGVSLGLVQPTLTVNTVFGDGVLSAADLASNQTLSGTSSLSAGSTVSATLNGLTYTTKVVSGGNWSISVPKADLAAITDGSKTVTVTGTDAYGNVANSSGTLSVISQSTPVVAITSLFGDNALSAADVKTAQTISGTASNAEGSVIRVTLGGQTYSTTVSSNGNWSLSVPAANLAAIADGLQTVTASVINGAGSTGSTSASLGVVSHTTPTVSVNSFFGGDGYLNIAEANTAETIRGTSTNAAGGTVTVNVAGNVLTTTIGANGAWSISVPSATLKGIADGSHPLTVTVTDIGGNTATSSSSFTALSHNQPVVGVDPVLSIVGSLLTGLVVQGGSLNAAQGSKVSVTLLLSNGSNGPTLNTTTDALGRYAVNFSPSLLSVGGLLLSLNTLAKVSITDVAGNSYTTTNTLLLGSLLPVTLAATESVALFSVVDDSAAVASTSVETQHNSSTSSDDNSAHVAVASTLITEADAVTPVSSIETVVASDTAVAAAPAEEVGYTIGGVVITLADGSTAEGASVTGSSGADTVTVSDLNFTHIDGGAGTDTLVLNGEYLNLDLTALGLKVEHVEVLDLGKTGTNSVKLDLNEALTITDKQSDDLLIKGADGSQVTLANSNGGIWEVTGERTVEGRVFEIYHNSALTSENTLGDVLVQQNLQVHVV
ncbi:Ig-like domain-containing protein [Pantoea sp. Bo_2]|uniref:Ig-like domain-containing protein n=1 Tax=unclassified Pantoea TaxID=2630326 RepID=UPI0012327AA9|nr:MULTISPECIES: Ig-like domain-containing protein [unclassified Pantoea]KAA5949818.1 Ig-like domain-containing protein [Pantoea sp. VH_3]KAA5954011.1 Ig-like domain-containing protein [Pantoea sp. VH_25]KAA5984316.1 Ig-like domain-containing protein [Pantoea sp. M_3]KAA6049759.1 Ig-like domain-containing protein [Pantoea sp. FN_2b]KAA6054559.1 Ig-like domain-containing protein [Pantoea sp. Bo_5]